MRKAALRQSTLSTKNDQPFWHISLPGLTHAARNIFLLCEKPWFAFLLALVIYGSNATIYSGILTASNFSYFNYLADAFLHGSLSLRLMPKSSLDLVYFAGKTFLFWPPFPAILLMPFVALFGVDFSDITFTFVLGALNVGLVAYLLRLLDQKEVIRLRPAERAGLVLFFAFGTVHFILAQLGRVWFTSQLVGFLAVLLAYIFVLRFHGWKAFLLAGLAIAAAAATRNNMVFAGIWPAWFLIKEHLPIGQKVPGFGKAFGARRVSEKFKEWIHLTGLALLGAAPVLVTVLLLAIYNYARFGNVLDVGIAYHNIGSFFVEDYRQYGAFNLHYIPINLYYEYLFYPLPIRENSFMGGSLFLLSPLFFAIFWAFSGSTLKRTSATFLVLSIMLVNIPILLLMGTGYFTFGPRYTLDFHVPLLMLTAMGLQKWPRWLIAASILLSIGQYQYGPYLSF